MFSRRILPFAALAAALAGCNVPQVAEQAEAVPPTATAPSPAPAAPSEGVIAGQGEFGVNLYRQLAEKPGNVFLSPASISTALGMVYAGAQAETAAEMAEALRYPAGDVHGAMGELLARLPIDAEGRVVRVANALWVQDDFPLRPEYAALVRRHYGGEANPVDYVDAPDQAIATINRWAEERTAGRIRNLLSRGNVTGDTRLILTNSIYFKADWLKPFSANSTGERPFLLPGGRSAPAIFMRQRGNFRVLKEAGFAALEAPYKGEELSMILFVPDSPDGLPAFGRGLDAAKLEGWIRALKAEQPGDYEFVLPKLQLATKASLVPPLQALGMRRAFTNSAQFGGIAPAALRVSDVIHQTFLLVDEKGTEAAAVTAPIMEIVSAPRPFHADRPFFFLIRDNRTGTNLFMGRIGDPTTMNDPRS